MKEIISVPPFLFLYFLCFFVFRVILLFENPEIKLLSLLFCRRRRTTASWHHIGSKYQSSQLARIQTKCSSLISPRSCIKHETQHQQTTNRNRNCIHEDIQAVPVLLANVHSCNTLMQQCSCSHACICLCHLASSPYSYKCPYVQHFNITISCSCRSTICNIWIRNAFA